MRRIVVMTGMSCSGKSSTAKLLKIKYGFEIVRTSLIIAKKYRCELGDKIALQKYGDYLDKETQYAWLANEIEYLDSTLDKNKAIVIDSVRNPGQLEKVRAVRDWQIIHVHLYAPQCVLEDRFTGTQAISILPEINYSIANMLKEQSDIDAFVKDADLKLWTGRPDPEDIVAKIAPRLGLIASADMRTVDVVIGGQYGSEGKGQIVGYLSKEYDLLMRVGGPNAGHSVSSESGLYVYHHLPSGCRDSSAEVLLGPGMTLKPAALVKEIEEVKISSDRLSIDPNAMVIEEEDLINEQELVEKIASTGRGGGSAAARRILNRYGNGIRLAKDVVSLKPYIRSTLERLQIAYRDKKSVLLEGTQGSALSLYHGKYPHVTSRDTNVAGCLAEAGISPTRVRRVIMVIRTHPIRVGNPDNGKDTSGYLKHETSWDEIARSAGLPIDDLVKTEITSTTKRSRRVGYFDWEQFQHAVALNSPTDIVLTFVDYISRDNRDARRFDQLDKKAIYFIEELERVAQAPVSLINTRFPRTGDERKDLRTVIDRRNWTALWNPLDKFNPYLST